jgi:hypothetical protein
MTYATYPASLVFPTIRLRHAPVTCTGGLVNRGPRVKVWQPLQFYFRPEALELVEVNGDINHLQLVSLRVGCLEHIMTPMCLRRWLNRDVAGLIATGAIGQRIELEVELDPLHQASVRLLLALRGTALDAVGRYYTSPRFSLPEPPLVWEMTREAIVAERFALALWGKLSNLDYVPGARMGGCCRIRVGREIMGEADTWPDAIVACRVGTMRPAFVRLPPGIRRKLDGKIARLQLSAKERYQARTPAGFAELCVAVAARRG